MRQTGWDDAPATGPAIVDMKRASQTRQLKATEGLRRATLLCDVITDILDDLATFSTVTVDYGNILPAGAAVSLTFVFYSCGEYSASCRL